MFLRKTTCRGLGTRYLLQYAHFCTQDKLQKVRYRHTNIVAKDWKKLATFYELVFGMKRIGPERNLQGQFVDEGVGYKNASICGVHMAMPGFEKNDLNTPTLEIFEYGGEISSGENEHKAINRQGFGHVAFEVDNIENAIKLILKYGGSMLSDSNKMWKHSVVGQGLLKWIYVRDNEGNIIELQEWDSTE
eukprot:72707_1